MYFHIILSERCNSQCRYCYKKSEEEFGEKLNKRFKFDFSAPCDSKLNVKELKKFLSKDKEPKIIFYGGEPLLNIIKIKEIMNAIPKARYYMQTNGKLLKELPRGYMNKFSKILISIDGDKKRTDFNRGQGTYEGVLKNIELIRNNGFKGEIVARMTISFSDKFTDLVKQIKHLLKIGFNSIHWQLDMGFYESDYNKKEVGKFIKKYNKEVSKLIKFWIKQMNKGKVLKIYPFLGIFNSLYYKTKTRLRCGSGYANYTINTNGKIMACPIMNCVKDFYVGEIKTNNPNKLQEISVIEPCPSCNYLDLCGGRCLYSNHAKLWPVEGEKQICITIKYLIDKLKKAVPEIKRLISKGIVNEKQFGYEKYFGPEIIP
jgi:putative peptide-modifying radical SAM enzyme